MTSVVKKDHVSLETASAVDSSAVDGTVQCITGSKNEAIDGDTSDDDLPIILEYIPSKLTVEKELHIKTERIDDDDTAEAEMHDRCQNNLPKSSLYSLNQLLADHNEDVKVRAMVVELKNKNTSSLDQKFLGGDDLLPEHKAELEKMNAVEKKIRKLHPGEMIFDICRFKSLFSFPESLTLTSCGFLPGHSRTDQVMLSLPPDHLLEFLSPELFRIVFPAISSQEKFLTFIFYLLSISPDFRISHRLHEILHVVLHGQLSTWTPSTFDVCIVLSNYGTLLSNICPDHSLFNFSETDLMCRFVKPDSVESCRETSQDKDARSAEKLPRGYETFNLKLITQFLTDSLAVRSENYMLQDCLALTLIYLRISLDHKLSDGQLSWDFELFFAAVINAVAPEHWNNWVKDLCDHLTYLTNDHHNMVYLVGLMPLVERGHLLKRVLSLAFMLELLPSSDAPENFLEPKVKYSLNFLKALQINHETDFYLTWSIVHLLESSVGPDPSEEEGDDLLLMIDVLQQKSNQIRDSIYQVDQIVVKDQLIWFISKLKLLVKGLGKGELFDSVIAPVMVEHVSNLPEEESEDETNMDTSERESE